MDNVASFADRLITRVRAVGHPLCAGLDPHLDRLPRCFHRGSMHPEDPATADVVESFLCAVIDRLAGKVAAVKPQIAFFEQLGWRGMRAFERVIHHARIADLLVVVDAKRGDIGSTAAGYAAAYLGPDAPMPADALTVNPYLGVDALAPLVTAASENGRGLFVLVKTSNRGAGKLQDLAVAGHRMYEHVANALVPATASMVGPRTGWSSLGVVVGATYPDDARRVRAALPKALFLVPGFGAQGAGAEDAVRGLPVGEDGRREGGLVNASRAILFPEGSAGATPARYVNLLDNALAACAGALATAVAKST